MHNAQFYFPHFVDFSQKAVRILLPKHKIACTPGGKDYNIEKGSPETFGTKNKYG